MLRRETNSQIARYLNFCDLSPENFDSPFETKFPLPLYYSRAVYWLSGYLFLSSNDLPSQVPSPPPPRYPTHHVSTPSSLPFLCSGRPSRPPPDYTGKSKPTSGPHQPAQDDKKAQTNFNLWTPQANQQRQQHDQEMSRGGRHPKTVQNRQ